MSKRTPQYGLCLLFDKPVAYEDARDSARLLAQRTKLIRANLRSEDLRALVLPQGQKLFYEGRVSREVAGPVGLVDPVEFETWQQTPAEYRRQIVSALAREKGYLWGADVLEARPLVVMGVRGKTRPDEYSQRMTHIAKGIKDACESGKGLELILGVKYHQPEARLRR